MKVQYFFKDNIEDLLELLSPIFDISNTRYARLIKYEDDGGASDIIYALYDFVFDNSRKLICTYSCDYPETVERATELVKKWCKTKEVRLIKRKEEGNIFAFEVNGSQYS